MCNSELTLSQLDQLLPIGPTSQVAPCQGKNRINIFTKSLHSLKKQVLLLIMYFSKVSYPCCLLLVGLHVYIFILKCA